MNDTPPDNDSSSEPFSQGSVPPSAPFGQSEVPSIPFGQPVSPPPAPVPEPPAYNNAQPAPQMGTYYGNQQGYQVSGPSTDGFAIAALVLGLIPCAGITSFLAVIFGFVSLSRIKKSNGQLGGKGLAIAGAILGAVWLVLLVFYFVFLALVTSSGY